MSLIERISDNFSRILPSMSSKSRPTMQAGIGSGHGMVGFQDDMIVSKPTIIFHASQIFFNFLAMACYASVASFQAKWKVGPSGLTGFAIFTSVAGMLLSAFMLAVPVIYEKHDKFVRLARALKEVRVSFILTGTGTAFSLLIAFIVTISAWTQPGCKNPDNDPHSEDLGDDFKSGLPGWCNTKKAAAIFFWLAFASWVASVIILVLDWRNGRLNAPRDPPFTAPSVTHDEEEGEEEEEGYTSIPPPRQNSIPYGNAGAASNPFADSNRYNTPSVSTAPSSAYTPASAPQPLAAGRPSMDAYGAFSDPAPSGFGASSAGGYSPAPSGYTSASAYATPAQTIAPPPTLPEPDFGPRMSRTMQYADPYSAVRASIGTPQAASSIPPSYESYQGYR